MELEKINNEQELNGRIFEVEEQAKLIKVIDNESFSFANNFLKQIKSTIKQIDLYWEEPKRNAYAAYKAINDKISEMKKALTNAEKLIKNELSDYVRIQEDEKRKVEELAKTNYGVNLVVDADIPKEKGTSFKTDYIIHVEDISKIPAIFNGIQILSVNEQAIKQLAKLSKGKIEIPGIKIEETKIVSVRV